MSNQVIMRISNIYLNLPLIGNNKDLDGDFYGDEEVYIHCHPRNSTIIAEDAKELEEFLEKSKVDLEYVFDIHQLTMESLRILRTKNPKHTFSQLSAALRDINGDDFVLLESDLTRPGSVDRDQVNYRRPFEPMERWKQRFFSLVKPSAVARGIKLTNIKRMYVDEVEIQNCKFTLKEYFNVAKIDDETQAKFVDIVNGNKRMQTQVKKMEDIFKSI